MKKRCDIRLRLPSNPSNTEKEILLRMRFRSAMTTAQLVFSLWPKTKQPEKKTVTVLKHLRQLERRGQVVKCGEVWVRVSSASPTAPRGSFPRLTTGASR